jgi:hypothetical protein
MTLTDSSGDSAVLNFNSNNTVTVGTNNLHITVGDNITNTGSGLLTAGFATSNGSTNATIVELVFEGYTFQVAASSSNQGVNGATFGNLQLQNVNVQNTGGTANSVTVSVSESGFTAPANGYAYLEAIFNASVSPNSSKAQVIETAGYSSSSFTLTPIASPIGSANKPLNNVPSYSNSFQSSDPYTLTDSIQISGLLNDGASVSASVNSTLYAPAPSGLILAASVIPFFGLLRRRLQRIATPVAAA